MRVRYALLIAALIILALFVGCAAGPTAPPTTPPTRAEPTRAPRANGAIESLTLITSTVRSEYYVLTYWSDRLRVKGFLGRPKADGAHPAVIYNRGGYRETGALEGWEIAPLVEAGYVAVASQYRGNGGSEGREEFGGADVNDVLNLVPLLNQLPDVDPTRIGMMGHSRGGMMTYLVLKHETLAGTHDIRAAVTVGGIADAFMLVKERRTFALLFGAPPEQAPELYEARSATCWPALINTPLLIQHGEADASVSVDQSRSLAEALQKAGKVCTLITYPNEDHPLSGHSGGFPEALAWFQKYLGRPGEDRSFDSHRAAIRAVIQWFKSHPPSDSPAPTPRESLVGGWRLSNLDLYFNEDGTFRVFKVSDMDDYPEYPEAAGMFWFDGPVLKLRDVDGFNHCATSQVGCYEVQVIANGQLRFVLIEDPCQGRAKALLLGSWVRISPDPKAEP